MDHILSIKEVSKVSEDWKLMCSQDTVEWSKDFLQKKKQNPPTPKMFGNLAIYF